MHIVSVHVNGAVAGYRLRTNGGGAGNSRYFASEKHGGPAAARRAARQHAQSLGLPKSATRGGSVAGRLLTTSTTGAAGIRFVWTPTADLPVLRVVATWIDKKGRARNTSYSVERNGLDGALDKAIKARTSAGAPTLDRDALLRRLRKVRRTGHEG